MMETIDKVANELFGKSKNGFFVASCEGADGIQIRYAAGYRAMMSIFAGIANCIMDDYVEENGYTVHCDLRDVLERTMMLNEKRPNDELFEKGVAELREIFSKYSVPNDEQDEEQTDAHQFTKEDIQGMIHSLRCCAETKCNECSKFMDEDEDGENKYTTLCSEALMIEAASMLEDVIERMD